MELKISDRQAIVPGTEALERASAGWQHLTVINRLGVVNGRGNKPRGPVGHREVGTVGVPAAECVPLHKGGGDFGRVDAVLAGAHQALWSIGPPAGVLFE